jgi:predicted amidohydrolase
LKLDIALVQTRTPDTHEAALAHVEPLIREAADRGAEFILTPEGTNVLQQDRAELLAHVRPLEDDPVVARLRQLARELRVTLLIGSTSCRDPGADRPSNRSVLVGPDGAVLATYDKIHMFVADLPGGEQARENKTYQPGDRAVVGRAPFGGVGMTVCYDLRFPTLYRRLAQAGAEMLTVPSAFAVATGRDHWEVLLRARAIENGAYVLAPAQGGKHADGRTTYGRSMVVDPWGLVIAQASGDEPQVIHASLDLDRVRRTRASLASLEHEREFARP